MRNVHPQPCEGLKQTTFRLHFLQITFLFEGEADKGVIKVAENSGDLA